MDRGDILGGGGGGGGGGVRLVNFPSFKLSLRSFA